MDNKIIKITKNKLNFVGISVKPDTTEDSGIAVLDEDLNIKYIDKAYRLNDIKFFVLQTQRHKILCRKSQQQRQPDYLY